MINTIVVGDYYLLFLLVHNIVSSEYCNITTSPASYTLTITMYTTSSVHMILSQSNTVATIISSASINDLHNVSTTVQFHSQSLFLVTQ